MNFKPFVLLLFGGLLFSCDAADAGHKSSQATNSTPEKATPSDPTEKSTKKRVATQPPPASPPAIPEGYSSLGEASGDLDKDRVAEKVIVYETPRTSEWGNEREIQIYRAVDGTWDLWHTSVGAVMKSEDGGMMGDPFEKVSVDNGCIVFEHFGGSREKWTYTHRFRFQNDDWQLIGVTAGNGTPCLDWQTFDYNLSTGKAEVKKEKEDCGDDGEVATLLSSNAYTQKLDKLPSMDGFDPASHLFEVPDSEEIHYY